MKAPAPTMVSRINRDGLTYALTALALDIVAAITLCLSLWNLASLDGPQPPPQLDPPRGNILRGLLTFILLFAPFLLAGWGRIWGAHARTLAALSPPYIRRLAWLSMQLALVDLIAGGLILVGLPFRIA